MKRLSEAVETIVDRVGEVKLPQPIQRKVLGMKIDYDFWLADSWDQHPNGRRAAANLREKTTFLRENPEKSDDNPTTVRDGVGVVLDTISKNFMQPV